MMAALALTTESALGDDATCCSRLQHDVAGRTRLVNRDGLEPAMPLDVCVAVEPLPAAGGLRIRVVAGRNQGFPADKFDDQAVDLRLTLPQGVAVRQGEVQWSGGLRGDACAGLDVVVSVSATSDVQVLATGSGKAAIGGRIDADSEVFWIRPAHGNLRIEE